MSKSLVDVFDMSIYSDDFSIEFSLIPLTSVSTLICQQVYSHRRGKI